MCRCWPPGVVFLLPIIIKTHDTHIIVQRSTKNVALIFLFLIQVVNTCVNLKTPIFKVPCSNNFFFHICLFCTKIHCIMWSTGNTFVFDSLVWHFLPMVLVFFYSDETKHKPKNKHQLRFFFQERWQTGTTSCPQRSSAYQFNLRALLVQKYKDWRRRRC